MEKGRIEHSATGLHSFVLAAAMLLTASMIADCSGGGASMPGPLAQNPAPCTPPCLAAEYVVPASTGLGEITAGPDGNLWFTGFAGRHGIIGRLTTTGGVAEFSTSGAAPAAISAGPDGDLWFSELGPISPFDSERHIVQARHRNGLIGRITTAGILAGFFTSYAGIDMRGIAVGSDGNIWFTESNGSDIGAITPAGAVSLRRVGRSTVGIAAGPDGNLWFTEQSSNQIGVITPAGVVTEFTVPTTSSGPFAIAAGPDGNLWFTEQSSNQIGRITPAGVVTEFAIPTANCVPEYIVAGGDGNLWFTEFSGNKIGRITTAGAITEFALTTAGSYPFGIAAGPDHNLYFTEFYGNKIGKFTP
jgi:streptogramin lyase